MADVDESKVNEQPPVVEDKKPDNKAENEEITRLKNALSKANTEAANWRKQYTATLDEAKRKEVEAEAQRKAEQEELATLRREKTVGIYAKKYMAAGIDGATADIMAAALPDGVGDDYFTAIKSFMENQRKALDVSALNKQPGLSVGMPPSGANKSDLDKQLDKIFGL